jgi:hypothetical protein
MAKYTPIDYNPLQEESFEGLKVTPIDYNPLLKDNTQNDVFVEDDYEAEQILSQEELQKEKYREYNTRKNGVEYSDSELKSLLSSEYQTSSFQEANDKNKEVLKHLRKKTIAVNVLEGASNLNQLSKNAFVNYLKSWFPDKQQIKNTQLYKNKTTGEIIEYNPRTMPKGFITNEDDFFDNWEYVETKEELIDTKTHRAVQVAEQSFDKFSDTIKSVIPKEWEESRDILIERSSAPLEGNALEMSMQFLDQGFSLLIDNGDELLASAANPVAGVTYMFAGNQSMQYDALTEAGVDKDTALAFASIYATAATPVEYIENVGRIASAFGADEARKKLIKNVFLRKLTNAGINVGEEALQKFFEDITYNAAVESFNEKNNTDIPLRDLKEGYGQTAQGSLAMTTVMEILGLSVKGTKRVLSKAITKDGTDAQPLTLGDVNKDSSELSEDERESLIEATEPTQRGKELLRNAFENKDQQSVDEYNNYKFGNTKNDVLGDLGKRINKQIAGNVVVGEKGNEFIVVTYDSRGNAVDTTRFEFDAQNKEEVEAQFDDFVNGLELDQGQQLFRYDESEGDIVITEEVISDEIIPPTPDEQQTLDFDLAELEAQMNSDKGTEVISTDAEMAGETSTETRGNQSATINLTPPSAKLDVSTYETKAITFFARLRAMGFITNRQQFDETLDAFDLHEDADFDVIYTESEKAYRHVNKKLKSANRLGRERIYRSTIDRLLKPIRTKLVIDEMMELKRQLQRTVRDIETGRKAGVKQEKERQKQREVKRNLLIKRAFRLIEIYIPDLKTKNRFKVKAQRLKTEKSLETFFNDLRQNIEQTRKKDSILRLKNIITKANKVDDWEPRYQDLYNDLIRKYLVTKLSAKKQKQLESRKEFIEGKEETLIPTAKLKEVEKLTAEAVENMTDEEINQLADQIDNIVIMSGKFATRRRNIADLNIKNKKIKLINSLKTKTPFVQNKFIKAILENRFLNMLRKYSFMVEELDDGMNQGVADDLLRQPLRNSGNVELERNAVTKLALQKIYDVLSKNWFLKRRLEKIKVGEKTLTIGEIMGLYAHSKNNDTRRKMLRSGQFRTQQQINKFISELTETEKSVVNKVVDLMNGQYEPMAAIAFNLTGKKPKQIKNYVPLIFTITKGAKEFNKDTDLLNNDGEVTNPYVSDGFSKERVGLIGDRELDLDFIEFSKKHLDRVNHYIAYAESTKQIQELLSDSKVTEQIERILGKEGLLQLVESFKSTVNPYRGSVVSKQFEGINNFFRAARMRMTVVNLGINFVSGLAQFSSFPLTIRRIGLKEAISGLNTMISPAFFENIKNVNEQSAMMANRSKSYDREYADYIRNKTIDSLFKGNSKVKDGYFFFMRTIDSITAYSSWIGAYNKGFEIYQDEAAAIRYADDVVEKTQPMADFMNLSAIQRGNEIQKAFVPFYTAFNHIYNEMDTQTRGALKGSITVPEWFGAMFWIILAPALYNHIIRNPNIENVTAPSKMAQSIFSQFTGSVPIFGGMASSLFNEFPYNPVPLFDSIKYGNRTKDAIGSGNVKKALNNAMILSGYIFPYPSRQAAKTIFGAYDLITDETDNLFRLIYSEYQLESKKKKSRKKRLL